LLARSRQLHPGNGASDSAARDENPRGLIREMRVSAEDSPRVTSPGCGWSHIFPLGVWHTSVILTKRAKRAEGDGFRPPDSFAQAKPAPVSKIAKRP
jgi:hypothetical protein